MGFQGRLRDGGVKRGQTQLNARRPCERQAGRKRPRPPQDAMSGRQQLPGRGRAEAGAHRSRPRLPYSRWPRAQELPEVGEVERTNARSHCPRLRARGIPKVEGSLCQVRYQVVCFLRPLTGSENPANRGRNPDDPVPPRSSPPPTPWAETAPRPAPSSAPTPPGTLISMTTWEDSLGGGGGWETPQVNHRQRLPGGPLRRQRSGRPTRTSVASN